MFELKVRVKSHWFLFQNNIEVISGSKIFIKTWLKKYYPEFDYKSLKITKLPSSFCGRTLTDIGLHYNPHKLKQN